jgi:hypothetical protein
LREILADGGGVLDHGTTNETSEAAITVHTRPDLEEADS